MDPSLLQHEHVVTIPLATNASNNASPNAIEDVQTAVSTSIANTEDQSRASQQRSCGWNNLWLWLIFDLFITSIQTFFLITYLPIFQDERARNLLQACIIGAGVGHLCNSAYKCRRQQSNQLLQVLPGSPSSKVDKLQSQLPRCKKIPLKLLWISLESFFALWLGVGLGILFTTWITKQAPHLNWLCIIFIAIGCFPYIVGLALGTIMCIWHGIRFLKANMISAASPTSKDNAKVSDLEANQANKEDKVRDSIGGDSRVGVPAAVFWDK